MQESNRKSLLLRMPVLPLRGMMVFPHMVLHFDVGRPKSVAALEKAMMGDQRIFLVAQMDAEIDEPELSDLCRVGTIAQIKQVLNLPGDSIRVLVEGVRRGVLGTVLEEDPCLMATVRLVREDVAPDTAEMKALVRTSHAFFEEYCNASMRVSQETLRSVMDVDKPDQLADIIAANVLTRLEDRQAILEKLKVKDRLEALCRLLQDLGGSAFLEGDCLVVQGGTPLTGGAVMSYGDHRIAMAAAVAASLCTGPVRLIGAEAVTKSYPRFWQDYQSLGGIWEEIS